MKRRSFVKALPALPVLTGAVVANESSGQDTVAGQGSTAAKATGKGAAAGGYGKKDLQEFAGIGHSDMGATDADGNPVEGEFSLAVVDLAVLALSDPNSQKIVPAFYGDQPLGVSTSLSLAASTKLPSPTETL